MKRVVLTGATGFVGRQIHRALTAAGHDVVAVIRPGSEDRLGRHGTAAKTVVSRDLFAESANWWAENLASADAVIHAAWYVEPGKYLDSPRNLDCLAGTLALAQGAVEAGVGHFIGIGTCMEYRLPSTALDISAPLEPSTLYAASKLSVYQMLGQYFASTGCGFSWCRLFYLFGENEYPSRLVPYIRDQLSRGEVARLSAGTQLRDFLDVRQAGEMIAGVIETGQLGAINICSGQAVSIRQLAESIADEYGRRDLLQFGTADIHPSDPVAVVGVCNAMPPATSPGTSGSGAKATGKPGSLGSVSGRQEPTVLHIMPHLGGGVGKAHAALCAADKDATDRHYVLLEAPRDTRYADIVRASGAAITIAPDAATLDAMMREADIVQFEWWNHPLLCRFLAWTTLPPMRSVVWSHVSGLQAPLIPPGLIGAVDRFLFTSTCSYVSRSLSGVLAENADRIGVVNSGFGFDTKSRATSPTRRPGHISYLGTVDFSKMSPALLEVIDRLETEVVVELFGSVADTSPVHDAIRGMRHPDRVRLRGHTDDPATVMAATGIFLYLLQPDHFGTAENALVEAMSLGCVPLVFANACELAIVTDAETGFVARDAVEAAARLDWMLANPEAVAEIGRRAGRDVARNRNPALSLAQFKTIWREVANMPKQTPDFAAALGATPADWYRKLQGLDKNDDLSGTGATSAASKGSLSHFLACFPDLDATG